MYKKQLEKQFMIDFNCDENALKSNIFTTHVPTKESRSFARNKANIVIYGDKLYVRTNKQDLTHRLEKEFQQTPPEWFFERQYIERLSQLLKEYELTINNVAPFFIPKKEITPIKFDSNNYKFFEKEAIKDFKKDKRIKMSFGYSEEYPDRLGLGYFQENKLIAICGASQDGKYTWDLGIEILDETFTSQGLAANLINLLTAKIQTDYPNRLPVFVTALSHTKSMNVAINAGYSIGWTEITID